LDDQEAISGQGRSVLDVTTGTAVRAAYARGTGGLLQQVKWQVETFYSSVCIFTVNNAWIYIFISPYIFVS
jgi:hypothetical protein